MQPTYPFARLLFFAGIFLLFSVPLLVLVIKKFKKPEVKTKELTQQLDYQTKAPGCCDNRKPGYVTIVI